MASAEEIAGELRARIRSGDLQPGDRLPTMAELGTSYEVNRQTARQALIALKDEGLVEYRGGRAGTFVRLRPTQRLVRARSMERDELGYYSGPDVQHWRALTQTEVDHTARVPEDIAALLGVEPGSPAVVRRRLNGDPEIREYRQLTDSWLHPAAVAAVPAIAGDSGLGGIYDRIEEWAGAPLVWEEEATSATPSPAEAEALLLPTGVPLLRLLRCSIVTEPPTGGGPLVVEVNDIRMSGEQFSVRYPLERGPSARWPVTPATGNFYTPVTPADPGPPGDL